MKTLLLFVFTTLLPSISLAQTEKSHCFYQHVYEAKVINKKRRPLYQALHNSKKMKRLSYKVSQKLISMEIQLLPLTRYFEWRSKNYKKNDIQLMCDNFIDMSLINKMQERLIEAKKVTPINANIEYRDTKKQIKALLNEEKYNQIVILTDQEIKSIKQNFPNHFCLYRHFLESIRLIAFTAPSHIEESSKKGLRSPAPLIRQLLNLHTFGFKRALAIDQMAIPLQNEGSKILCNDVPHITTGQI